MSSSIDPVDEAGFESFPASDAPAWWSGSSSTPGGPSNVDKRAAGAVADSSVQVRRVFEAPQPADGYRVLVDRLWPRGVTKDQARLDEWCKQAAPSAELRKWYGHDRQRFSEFRRRYRAELAQGEAAQAIDHLRQLATARTLTLVTASKDPDISAATVLVEMLEA